MRTKFSSRPRFLVTVIITALVALSIFFVFEEMYLLPSVANERAQRVAIFPAVLAVANQTAIITNDLANLRASLEKTMSVLEGSGIRYIIIQDADGKIMAEAHEKDLTPEQHKAIIEALRARGRIITRKSNETPGVANQSRFSAEERAAMTGGAETSTEIIEIPEGFLPKVENSGSWNLTGISPEIVDHSVPIASGSIPFGGVRVGVVDEVTAGIDHLRVLSYTAFGFLVIGAGMIALFMANGTDAKFGGEMAEKLEAVRKEMEAKIRQLEVDHQRKDEENPITPGEFLSLLDFARKVSASMDYNEILTMAIHACLQVMNVKDASIFVLDGTTNELVGRIGHDENGLMPDDEMSQIRVPVGKGDIGAAAEFGTTTTIDTPRPGSGVVSALVSRGRTIGVILVRNKLNSRPFIKKDQTIVRIFSGLLANAMESAAIFHHLNRTVESTTVDA